MTYLRTLLVAILPLGLIACSDIPSKPIHTVDHVDIKKFMGDWYVIANIPTFIETDAYNAVESYELNEDGSISTSFTFREGGFAGKKKAYHPTGFVVDHKSNAVWGMQFIWPFKADYRIVYLNEDYRITVIGRQKRDYVWIMARSPDIPDTTYQHLLNFLTQQGYDASKIHKVPQDWSVNRSRIN